MPSPERIKLYQKALEANRAGKTGEAAELLAQSLGQAATPEFIAQNIHTLLDTDTTPNDIILRLLSTEVSKREAT